MSKPHILAITIFLLVSNSALGKQPNWLRVSSSDTASSTFYIDTNNIVWSGSKVKVWGLIDYLNNQTAARGYIYRSLIDSQIYDCIESTMQIIQESAYSGAMGSGNMVDIKEYNDANKVVIAVVPGSTGDHAKDFLCSSK